MVSSFCFINVYPKIIQHHCQVILSYANNFMQNCLLNHFYELLIPNKNFLLLSRTVFSAIKYLLDVSTSDLIAFLILDGQGVMIGI